MANSVDPDQTAPLHCLFRLVCPKITVLSLSTAKFSVTIKNLKIRTPEKNAVIILKVEQFWFHDRVMRPKDADGMAN